MQATVARQLSLAAAPGRHHTARLLCGPSLPSSRLSVPRAGAFKHGCLEGQGLQATKRSLVAPEAPEALSAPPAVSAPATRDKDDPPKVDVAFKFGWCDGVFRSAATAARLLAFAVVSSSAKDGV